MMSGPLSIVALLRGHAFFASLDEAALTVLAGRVTRRKLSPGETLFHRDDPGDAMFIVETGAIRLARDSAQGREFTVRLAGPGEAFGEIALLDGAGRTTDAAAVTPSTLLSLSRRDFQTSFRATPAMQDAVLAVLCGRLRATTDQLETIALKPLEGRVAHLFLLFAGPDAAEKKRASFDIPVDQRELAALAGATRPRVNRVLMNWAESGVMRRKGRRCDCDLEALRAIVEGEDDA
ncbi:Crp/Fnr family transcriptional regulator [Terrarubrum flagellatum]|uniref:Crp/Fnr family transcriptional regulator n=1 Tax=Terrirubrum flagellatum TaxID=2895980 RepID=UPI0031456665